MRELLKVPYDTILATISRSYAITALAITFLPVGNDARASLFRVDSDDGRYICKLFRTSHAEQSTEGAFLPAVSLAIPDYLHHWGMKAVVAPLPTIAGDLAIPCEDFVLSLYPFINGETGMALGLTDGQWQNFGDLLRQLHEMILPTDLASQVPHEIFTLRWIKTIDAVIEQVNTARLTDPISQEFCLLWQERQQEIDTIVARTQTLGRQLCATPPPLVLCHADIHTANLLVDEDGALHIVDWDGVMLAPKERDLMFITERAAVQHPHERAFFAGYGLVPIDPVAFAYYRYEWVVQELADYGSRILLRTDLGEATRQAALAEFRQLFAPGDVVDVAYGADMRG